MQKDKLIKSKKHWKINKIDNKLNIEFPIHYKINHIRHNKA